MNRMKRFSPQFRQLSRQMMQQQSRYFSRNLMKQGFKLSRKQNRMIMRVGQKAKRFATQQQKGILSNQDFWMRLGIGGVAGAAGFFALNYLLNDKDSKVLQDSQFKTLSPAVRDFIRGTYAYLFGGLMITTLTATQAFRTGLAARIAAMGPMAYLGVFGLGSIGLLMATRMISPENVLLQNMSYAAFTALQGVAVSTLGYLGGRPLMKAGVYTMAIFAAMTLVASVAKEETFLYLGGPLMAGLFVMIAASVANMFIPSTGRVGFALNNFVIYGGLLLFVAFLLYDTQKMVYNGKQYASRMKRTDPSLRTRPDYIGNALHIYMDVLNIFIRLALIFGGQNRRSRGEELTTVEDMKALNDFEGVTAEEDQL